MIFSPLLFECKSKVRNDGVGRIEDKVISILVEAHIVLLHFSPMPPSKGHLRRSTIHLQHLPRKSRHHAFEGLVTRHEVRSPGTVIFIRLCDDSVVSPDLQHVLGSLRGPAVDCEGVVRMIDGPPVRKVGFERSLDFPVLDEVLDKAREVRSKMVRGFGWDIQQSVHGGLEHCGHSLTGRLTLFPHCACIAVVGSLAISPLCVVLEDGVGVSKIVWQSGR